MSQARITAEAASFCYPDGSQALHCVSLDIQPGESVALIGANGAGKSTLLQQFNGILRPDAGRVLVGGMAVTRHTLPQVRRLVGTVFQDPDDQLFMPTVFDDVMFGPLNMRLPEVECRERAQTALEQVGAWALRDRPPHRLSGGEKRRVALAAVLAMTPAVLLLDEPTAALDPRARRQVIALLKAFAHTRIIATHDLEMVLELAPRAICLREGEVAADGPSAEILRDAALMEACGLEVPAGVVGCPRCGRAKF